MHLYPHHSSLVAPGTPGLLPEGLWDRARTRIAAPYRIPPAASVLRPTSVGNATTPVLHKFPLTSGSQCVHLPKQHAGEAPERNAETGCVLRHAEKRSGENVPETKVHQ